MNIRAAALAAFALLAACGDGPATAQPSAVTDPAVWTIGPVIRGRNYSHHMPLHPAPARGALFQFDIPEAPGSVHYVTFPHGPLVGKRRIVMRFRIEAAPGVRILPRTAPSLPSIATLYFQRAGDNWSGRGRFETYRWYATFASLTPLGPGTHTLVAPLNGSWTAVERSTARSDPEGFRAALAEADQVGFVLGGGDGYGHGIFATGRARLIVTDFRVE